MKPSKAFLPTLVLLFFFTCGVGNAQITIKSLTISKMDGYSHRTNLNLSIPVAPGLPFFKLNTNKSQFTVIKDDTGFDLAANGKGVLKENIYTYLNTEINEVEAVLEIDGAPAKGAKTMILTGTLVMEYEDDSKTEEVTLDMPFKNSIQTPVLTEIGTITIISSGSLTTGEGVEYQTYYLETDVPLTSVKVVGGDDSKEYQDMGAGLEVNTFVFKTEPENITFLLGVASVKSVDVPLNLEFGIGL